MIMEFVLGDTLEALVELREPPRMLFAEPGLPEPHANLIRFRLGAADGTLQRRHEAAWHRRFDRRRLTGWPSARVASRPHGNRSRTSPCLTRLHAPQII